jgi:hypothetical protein
MCVTLTLTLTLSLTLTSATLDKLQHQLQRRAYEGMAGVLVHVSHDAYSSMCRMPLHVSRPNTIAPTSL